MPVWVGVQTGHDHIVVKSCHPVLCQVRVQGVQERALVWGIQQEPLPTVHYKIGVVVLIKIKARLVYSFPEPKVHSMRILHMRSRGQSRLHVFHEIPSLRLLEEDKTRAQV